MVFKALCVKWDDTEELERRVLGFYKISSVP